MTATLAGGVAVLLGMTLVTGCGGDLKLATAPTSPAVAAAGTVKPQDSAEPSYGSLPTYLPTDGAESDTVLTASAARPALTSQGDVVRAQLAKGSVSVLVSGPQVPAEGLPYVSPTSTCTWTITLSQASADIPLDPATFSALDHFGATYHPKVVAGQPKPPPIIKPGQTVTFELRTRMKIGEGLMRWAPDGQNVASWDFVVETD